MTFTVYDILILIGVPSLIVLAVQTALIFVLNKYRKKKSTDDDIRLGVQALLRNELLRQGKVFTEDLGYCSLPDKENYDNMYNRYHNLGKNGVMDSLHERVMALPTSRDRHYDVILEPQVNHI